MELLDVIQDQVAAMEVPLFAITVAAVPCPDTPIILTLHWHGFSPDTLEPAAWTASAPLAAIPSSALQLNDRWDDLRTVDHATMEAAWQLGAWDVAREERRPCMRPGASSNEAFECLQAFGAFPFRVDESQLVVSDAPDKDELLTVAAKVGYLMWLFRPVCGGIWGNYTADATLNADGTRVPPCPVEPIPPVCEGRRRTVYRFGRPGSSKNLLNS
jgi:hypothetical protein